MKKVTCDFCGAHAPGRATGWRTIRISTLTPIPDMPLRQEAKIELDVCPRCAPLLGDLRYVMIEGFRRARECHDVQVA